MFGMSFGEILVVAIIAILFVGPDKLPDALVKIAKFFRSIKSTINEAKESFDRELQIKELKQEALNYKKQLQSSIYQAKEDSGLDKLDELYEEFNSINKSIATDDFEEEFEDKKDQDENKLKKAQNNKQTKNDDIKKEEKTKQKVSNTTINKEDKDV